MSRILIPDYEYKERVARAAELIKNAGLDVLIVNSTESDYANVRYFSGFWPLFERAGVAISAGGDAALMVGPESKEFGGDRNKLDKIFVLKAYREGADPSYPELQADTYHDVFKAIGVTGENIKIGLGSYVECTLPIYEGLKDSFPKAEIVKCNDIMVTLRKIKSINELACIQEGFRIVDLATDEVIRHLKPGVTELQSFRWLVSLRELSMKKALNTKVFQCMYSAKNQQATLSAVAVTEQSARTISFSLTFLLRLTVTHLLSVFPSLWVSSKAREEKLLNSVRKLTTGQLASLKQALWLVI